MKIEIIYITYIACNEDYIFPILIKITVVSIIITSMWNILEYFVRSFIEKRMSLA